MRGAGMNTLPAGLDPAVLELWPGEADDEPRGEEELKEQIRRYTRQAARYLCS